MSDLRACVARIADFLEESQDGDGGFAGLSGSRDLLRASPSSTTFHASLILLCLSHCSGLPSAKRIGRKGAAYLLSQKNADWTWNYWKKGTEKFPPPDWDDTACALAALTFWAPAAMTGGALRAMTESLIAAEAAPGGPYSTWIVPRDIREQWQDIDPVVNFNIAFLLKLQGISAPSLATLAEKCLRDQKFPSQYYFSPVTSIHSMSRSYDGPLREAALQMLLKEREASGTWKNELETALAASALIRLGAPLSLLKEPIEQIVNGAREKVWPPHALYIEERHGMPTYSGSAALTAAFCLEALALHADALDMEEAKKRAVRNSQHSKKISAEILSEGLASFACDARLRERAEQHVIRMIQKDPGNQIMLLPHHFSEALARKDAPKQLMVQLGAANLLGWLAYRIYDDLLDNEGCLEDIPVANMVLRGMTSRFSEILSPEQATVFNEIMNGIEKANAWERANCFVGVECSASAGSIIRVKKLPSYGNLSVLAEKSLGHALGPLAILMKQGFGPESEEVAKTRGFFANYIIARQLNDDAHDWLEDLERGFLNSSSVDVLREWEKSGESLTVDLSSCREALQSIFWHKTILIISKLIFAHIKKARNSLASNAALADASYLESLLLPIERATEKAVHDRKQMLEFLAHNQERRRF